MTTYVILFKNNLFSATVIVILLLEVSLFE